MQLKRFKANILSSLVYCSALIFACSQVFAAPSKKTNSMIEIQSDLASFEQITRQAIHEGNVIMKQDKHILYADKLIIQKNEKGALSEVTAKGNPAIFKGQLGEKQNNPLEARAKTIHYYPIKQLIVLEGDATIIHQQDKFHGPSLSYQMDKQIVLATKQNQERPTIIFYPQATN